jgi:hypothetical protein
MARSGGAGPRAEDRGGGAGGASAARCSGHGPHGCEQAPTPARCSTRSPSSGTNSSSASRSPASMWPMQASRAAAGSWGWGRGEARVGSWRLRASLLRSLACSPGRRWTAACRRRRRRRPRKHRGQGSGRMCWPGARAQGSRVNLVWCRPPPCFFCRWPRPGACPPRGCPWDQRGTAPALAMPAARCDPPAPGGAASQRACGRARALRPSAARALQLAGPAKARSYAYQASQALRAGAWAGGLAGGWRKGATGASAPALLLPC